MGMFERFKQRQRAKIWREGGMSYEDAYRIMTAKGFHMVMYLRERRGMNHHLEYRRETALTEKQRHRRKYFVEKETK